MGFVRDQERPGGAVWLHVETGKRIYNDCAVLGDLAMSLALAILLLHILQCFNPLIAVI